MSHSGNLFRAKLPFTNMLLSPSQSRAAFAHALENGYAILAVNADSPACVRDVLEAARQSHSPIIIETSLWQLQGHSFGAGDAILGLQTYLAYIATLCQSKLFREVPVIFHTDHIKGAQTLAILEAAIKGVTLAQSTLGASTISLDSSDMSQTQNLHTLTHLCAFAKDNGCDLTLEAESGVDDGLTNEATTRALLGGLEEKFPGTLALWAPGVGTRHGLGEESAFSASHVQFQRELAHQITGRDIGIALHGSSGLSTKNLQDAVQAGVVKVNWSSESLLLRSRAALEFYDSQRAVFKGEKNAAWKNAAMDNGVQNFVSKKYVPQVCQRIEVLGGQGQAQSL